MPSGDEEMKMKKYDKLNERRKERLEAGRHAIR